MLARLSAFVIWALIAATAVFWGLRLAVRPAPVPAHALALGDAAVASGDLTRLFGAAPVATTLAAADPEASSRFRLLGIMAPPQRVRSGATGQGGLALIAVDGKPARAYTIGAHIDANLVLQSVSLRTASIGPAQGTQTVVLEVPPLAAAATGTLPPPGSAVARPAPVTVSPVPAVASPAAIPQPPANVPAAGLPPDAVPRDGGALTQ